MIHTHFVGRYFGRARFWKTSFPRSYLGNCARYVPFEDTQLPVFENVEEYLRIRFGIIGMKCRVKKPKACIQPMETLWTWNVIIRST